MQDVNLGTVVSEFYGVDDLVDRYACVRDMGKFVHVEFYDDIGLKEIRRIRDKTIRYCEDCAENWVLGVIKE